MMKAISCNHREVRCKSDAIWKVGDLSKTNWISGQVRKAAEQDNGLYILLYFEFPLPTKFGKVIYVILKPDCFSV